jgi:DNA-nicking Smr family endonuclease
MKRPPRPDEIRLWSRVASTVHPIAGKTAPDVEPAPAPVQQPLAVKAPPKKPPRQTPPSEIEPNRLHRIGRAPLEARLDLHGLDQDRARATLEAFIHRAWDDGYRSVLIITGKGARGEGVLRKLTPEWLAAPSLREIVAGISTAKRRHGGEGALYVALKRRPRP